MLRNIVSMGHEIGLHFDEAAYSDNMDYKALCPAVGVKPNIGKYFRIPKDCVDAPSITRFLESNYEFTDLINVMIKHILGIIIYFGLKAYVERILLLQLSLGIRNYIY